MIHLTKRSSRFDQMKDPDWFNRLDSYHKNLNNRRNSCQSLGNDHCTDKSWGRRRGHCIGSRSYGRYRWSHRNNRCCSDKLHYIGMAAPDDSLNGWVSLTLTEPWLEFQLTSSTSTQTRCGLALSIRDDHDQKYNEGADRDKMHPEAIPSDSYQ